MPMSLLHLPPELLYEIFKSFESFHTLKSLLLTCRKFHHIVKDLVIVINDKDSHYGDECLEILDSVRIDTVSLEKLNYLMVKYNYFIFDIDCDGDYTDITIEANVKMVKLLLKILQNNKIFHTIYINSEIHFSKNPLMRFLLPKLNSKYTEFFFPLIENINGFDDLRLLDNTNCVFDKLERFTIGSFSFQLFNLTASHLKVFNHSDQVKSMALNESVSARKISYSKFLSQLKYSELTCLDLVSWVEPITLNRFMGLKILRIYGDHLTKTFNLAFFHNLQELVISKCYDLESIENLDAGVTNEKLEIMDLSYNKHFKQCITGEFKKLRVLDLGHTAIKEYPRLLNIANYRTKVNVDGCEFIAK